jgi:hypothetical protein
MPKLAEAALPLAGVVIDVSGTTDFETKDPDGVRVVVSTGEGFASVKLNLERAAELAPRVGRPIAWLIRYGAYSARNSAETFAAFVRVAEPRDGERLTQHVRESATPTGQPVKAAA